MLDKGNYSVTHGEQHLQTGTSSMCEVSFSNQAITLVLVLLRFEID